MQDLHDIAQPMRYKEKCLGATHLMLQRRWAWLYLVFISGGSLAAVPVPVLLVSNVWPPYVSTTPWDGLTAELSKAALDAAGIPATLQYYPWLRCEEMLRSGLAFAAFPYAINAARHTEFDFSTELLGSSARFFYLKSHFPSPPPFQQLGDLKNLRIAGTAGYWYEPAFRQTGLTLDMSVDEEASFNKLKLGRVDLVPENEAHGWWLINKQFPGQAALFSTLARTFDHTNFYLMVSRRYPASAALLARLNQGLAQIRANGVYARILAKYHVSGE